MDAEVRGVIRVGAGGCLGIVTEGRDTPIALIWPAGSTLANDGKSMQVPEVGQVAVGKSVVGAGGEISRPTGDRFSQVPPECVSQDVLIDAAKITSAS